MCVSRNKRENPTRSETVAAGYRVQHMAKSQISDTFDVFLALNTQQHELLYIFYTSCFLLWRDIYYCKCHLTRKLSGGDPTQFGPSSAGSAALALLRWLCWLHVGGKERDNIIANDAKSSLAFFFYTLRPIQRYSIIVAHWYLDVRVIQTAAACVCIVFLFKWPPANPPKKGRYRPPPSTIIRQRRRKSNQWKCVGIFLPRCVAYIFYMRIPLFPFFFSWQKIRRRCLMSSIHWVHFVPRIYRGWLDAGVRSRLHPLTSIASSSFLVFHHFLYTPGRPFIYLFFFQSLALLLLHSSAKKPSYTRLPKGHTSLRANLLDR